MLRSLQAGGRSLVSALGCGAIPRAARRRATDAGHKRERDGLAKFPIDGSAKAAHAERPRVRVKLRRVATIFEARLKARAVLQPRGSFLSQYFLRVRTAFPPCTAPSTLGAST
jgi:hypothetical protein